MKKKVVRENKLKTFYLNFTKNKKNNTDQGIAGLLFEIDYLIWRGLTFSSKF